MLIFSAYPVKLQPVSFFSKSSGVGKIDGDRSYIHTAIFTPQSDTDSIFPAVRQRRAAVVVGRSSCRPVLTEG